MSVWLPEWRHSAGFASRDPEVLGRLQAGYPRFNMHQAVLRLEERLARWAAVAPGEGMKLFPSERTAAACQAYLNSVHQQKHGRDGARVALDGKLQESSGARSPPARDDGPAEQVYLVAYPHHLGDEACLFWQHTGYDVSSRFADYWLNNAPFLQQATGAGAGSRGPEALPVQEARAAADGMLRHIAGLYSTPETEASPEDVFLFLAGMSAITHTAVGLRTLAAGRQGYRVAAFG